MNNKKILHRFLLCIIVFCFLSCAPNDPTAKYCWTHVPEEYKGTWGVYKIGGPMQKIADIMISDTDIYIIGEGFSVSHFLRQNADIYTYEERYDYKIYPYTLIIRERNSSRSWEVGFGDLYTSPDAFLVFLDTPVEINQIYSLRKEQ